jgi:hypothetical protein
VLRKPSAGSGAQDPREKSAIFEALHQRLLAGDAEARDRLIALLVSTVRLMTKRRCPAGDPADIGTAVDDKVLYYLAEPARYDPHRSPLPGRLTSLAINEVRDFQRSRRRRQRHEIAKGMDVGEAVASVVNDADHEREARERWLRWHRDELLAAAETDAERALVEARLTSASRSASRNRPEP